MNNHIAKSMFKIIRTYALLLAIGCGFFVFLGFHFIPELAVFKPAARVFAEDALPICIFIMLYCSFCKIKLKEMRPRKWHLYLALFQFFVSFFLVLIFHFNQDSAFALPIEGAVICIITPTAAAAPVITGKLGGNESSVTSFIIISNILAAVGIPLMFPLLSPNIDESFVSQFITILQKVFPVVILPLIAAFLTKKFIKPLYRLITTTLKDLGFYIWVMNLLVISAKTFSNIANSSQNVSMLLLLALVGMLCTIMQFAFGKFSGHFEGQRISAGQGCGQKNMVFGLWIALMHLSPAAAIAPGCYILWQNIANSVQLSIREKNVDKCRQSGVEPYQE